LFASPLFLFLSQTIRVADQGRRVGSVGRSSSSGGSRRELVLVFILVVNRSKSIIRILSLVINFFLFCFYLPDPFLVEGELAPAVACVDTCEIYDQREIERGKPMILDNDP
jgi:hypothetical protein